MKPGSIIGNLLDVGCGAISVWEAQRDLSVTAIDPLLEGMAQDPRLSKFAKLGEVKNCFYMSSVIDGADWDQAWDWVWSYNVLDHSMSWRADLKAFYRVLRPAGVLFLGVDVRKDGQWTRSDDKALHPSPFSISELLLAIEESGFKIEWQRPLPDKHMLKYRFGARLRRPA
jgi:SAM-dependent methyltransferase